MLFLFARRLASAPLALAAACAAMFSVSSANACSTCKCADPTINLLGTEKPFSNRFRIGLDYFVLSESSGTGYDKQDTEEWRTLLGLAWSANENLTLAAQIPWVRKKIESPNLARSEAEGIGDIDLLARYVVHRSGGGSGRNLFGLRVGIRLPSSDQVRDKGEKLDIDVQPDAGSTVPNVGVWYSRFQFPWFLSTSLTYFSYGEANQDFSPGDAAIFSALGQYGLNYAVALQLGIDARYAQKNHFSGASDPDSGGILAMAFAGLAVRALNELIISVGVQQPIVERLKGEQNEDASFRVGLTYDF